MVRIEILANRSVATDIEEILERTIPDFYYTVVPVVHGKGRQRRRLGTPTWPEENFMLIAYLSADAADAARRAIGEVKARFPREGIKLFAIEAGE